jgi:hypothetical protein
LPRQFLQGDDESAKEVAQKISEGNFFFRKGICSVSDEEKSSESGLLKAEFPCSSGKTLNRNQDGCASKKRKALRKIEGLFHFN